MDTMQVNKACAAVLVAGIAFFVAGRVSTVLVPETGEMTTHIAIDMPKSATAATAEAPAEPPFAVLLASATPEAGKTAFASAGCVACHTVAEGGKAGVGPNLYGIMGADQAKRPGYTYSAALSAKTGKWDFDELNKWLTKPSAYAAGTKMTFAGLPDGKKRAAVIAYLNSLQATPTPVPAAP